MDKTNKEKLKECVCFIKATNFEEQNLWEKNNKQTFWIQDLNQYTLEIGKIGKNKTVWVCFSFAKIFDQPICFYDTTSRYNDVAMVDAWIDKHSNPKKKTNAMNFHTAVNYCMKLQKQFSNTAS